MRRVWSKGLFKGQISPHEVLQSISNESKKHYTTKNYEAIEFLSWFLNILHTKLGGTKKPGSSVIHKAFQGLVQVSTYDRLLKKKPSKSNDEESKEPVQEESDIEGYATPTKSITPFLYLSLDIPPLPVFTAEGERDIIPQVPLFELLNKFNGQSVQVRFSVFILTN